MNFGSRYLGDGLTVTDSLPIDDNNIILRNDQDNIEISMNEAQITNFKMYIRHFEEWKKTQ